MDQEYAAKFGNEERMANLAIYFALLAIVISCMGVLGICALSVDQRKKEIGVRKVLGASIFQLWMLLSKEYLILICMAFLLALPLGYYLTENWLDNFVYRITMSWWILAFGGLLILLLALVTVSFHTIQAAMANPSESLTPE